MDSMMLGPKKLIKYARKWEKRFVLPLSYLSNHIFQELFKISEEEFGLSSSEHITLPSSNNSFLMNYMLSLVNRGLTVDMEKALLNSIITRSCSINSRLHQGRTSLQLLLWGY
ncbi:auxin-induced protein 6B-like [Pyrus ussuriensis x Pyrus communis]|uniref:Auxin-induced protein 6B-like n=1 Tax=Pyrus ussuriensis x Pyrus communis TaxID=2448454 RepID=A0A5N5F1Z2_9ROSA|nr:auxin-induced protein 6B-like [Pyrus ussuriensis x Pyrus communis]KAB2604705.1 auxin-induced protein 6B-like [Pyrus ussuriensis x Pyrus communis]